MRFWIANSKNNFKLVYFWFKNKNKHNLVEGILKEETLDTCYASQFIISLFITLVTL